MSKIGNSTSSAFIAVIQQYLMAPVLGEKVVMSDPHPDAPGTSAVGQGKTVIIEKLPQFLLDGDEEMKYSITIKK